MEIVDVEIAPEGTAHITPLELIEDFADVAPNWHLLEEDTRLYAAVRGKEACVIRAWRDERAGSIDYAFAAHSTENPSALRMIILGPAGESEPVPGRDESISLQLFLKSFNQYVESKGMNVRIDAVQVACEETIA